MRYAITAYAAAVLFYGGYLVQLLLQRRSLGEGGDEQTR